MRRRAAIARARRRRVAARRRWPRCSATVVSSVDARRTSSTRSSRSRSSSRSTSSSATRASSRSGTSASSRSARGRPACSRCRSSEKPAIMPNLAALPRATRRSATAVARARRGRRRRLRARRRAAADAALGARRRHRHLRACSRSRTTCSATTRRSGPGLNTFSSVPETTGIWQAAIGARASRSPSRSRTSAAASAGCCARRARIPRPRAASGISIYRQRLVAFTLSGALAGLRGRALRPPAAAEHASRSIST